MDTRQFAVEQAAKLLGQFAFQISHTLKSRDPNSVHEMRVATRRFAQIIIAFGPCFPAKDVKKIRRRLKGIMTLSGDVRDCDIAMKWLLNPKLVEVAALQSQLQNRRKQAERMLMGMLKRWIDRKTSLKWRTRLQTVSAGNTETLPGSLQEMAARMLPRMTKKFFDRGTRAARASGSTDELHRFRLAAKKFRYTLELFAPVYGPTLSDRLEQVRTIQGLLGAINDCATVRKMLSQFKGIEKSDAGLKKTQAKKVEQFRRRWTDEFADPENALRWSHYFRSSLAAKKPMARSGAIARGAAAFKQSGSFSNS